jgi:hypothetical protein
MSSLKPKKYLTNFMVKILFIFIFFVFMGIPTFAATIYMGSSEPYKNLQAAMSAMKSGDTLIIRDGTYSGASNVIDDTHYPPAGSLGAWTTIKAEHDGAVIFDGENLRNMFGTSLNFTRKSYYWQFEGIIWCRTTGSNVGLVGVSHAKFLRCGAFDSGTGNVVNWSISRYCTYILLEGCYAWGSGRYKFLLYGYYDGATKLTNHIIVRNCVARMDRVIAGGEPIAGYSAYSTDYVLFQNCIAIDSDQTSYWSGYSSIAGAFVVPSTDGNSDHTSFVNCIGINNAFGGIGATGNEYRWADNTSFTNCVIWDSYALGGAVINNIRGLNTIIQNCNFGVVRDVQYHYLLSYDAIGYNNNTVLKNSIFYNIDGNTTYDVLNDVETQAYNAYYENGIGNGNTGTFDKTNINPLNGSLKYLTRIESGSALKGAGESGADIGANVLTLIGTPGTLYGETGYNTDTKSPMWPFPNENLIKEKMAAYTWDSGNGGEPEIRGDRGFAADGETLTNYIWGYLGNTLPPFNVKAEPGNAKAFISWNTNNYDAGVTGYKIYKGDNSGNYTLHTTVEGNTPNATVTGLTNNEEHKFVVRTLAAGVESGDSYEVKVTPIPIPPKAPAGVELK